MKRILTLLLLSMLLTTTLRAEWVRLTLNNKQVYTGEVIINNDDVIIIKDESGMRYQYQKQQVADIQIIEKAEKAEKKAESMGGGKKVAIEWQITGGVAWQEKAGGSASTMIGIGSFNLLNKHIFLGGAVGYCGYYLQGSSYNFIPIALRVTAPLIQKDSAPFAGASIGYGFQAKKGYNGGVYSSLDIGWMKRLTDKSALYISLNGTLQQGQIEVVETIGEQSYKAKQMRFFGFIGPRLSLVF